MPLLFAMAFVICHIYTKFSKSICHLSQAFVIIRHPADKGVADTFFICNGVCHLSSVLLKDYLLKV